MQWRILGRIAITLAFVTFLGFVPLPDAWLCRESTAAIRLLWGGFLLFVTWRDMNFAIAAAELGAADDLRQRWANRQNV